MSNIIDLTPIFMAGNIKDVWVNVKFVPGKGYELTWGDGLNDYDETFPNMSEVLARAAMLAYCGERRWDAFFTDQAEPFRDAMNNFFFDHTYTY